VDVVRAFVLLLFAAWGEKIEEKFEIQTNH
jgi:hypothetical protein